MSLRVSLLLPVCGLATLVSGCGGAREMSRANPAQYASGGGYPAAESMPMAASESSSNAMKSMPAAPMGAPGGMAAMRRSSQAPPVSPTRAEAQMPLLEEERAAKAAYNPNLYLSDTYSAGAGERDRIEKLINEGVEIKGKRVKLASFPRAYRQSFPIPTGKAIGLNTATESAKIVESGGKTYLQVGLQAIKGERPRRPALNVALVIDRSGSMLDEDKLVLAIRAARDAIERLQKGDVVSVVVFDDAAQVLVPATKDHDMAARKIGEIGHGGGTNIYDGLRLGYREVAKNAARDGVNLVLLLSDGEVTSGNSDPESFRKMVEGQADKEVQTSSIGMGIQFDEELMQALARTGGGSYHFVKDGADAKAVFAKELHDLGQVVARAVKVRIVLAKDVGFVRALGQNVLDARGVAATRREEKKIDQKVYDELGITRNRKEDEPGIKMLIPNFRRGDNHVIMLEIQAPRGRGTRKLADVHLKYKDLAFRANREESQAVNVQYSPDRGQVVASINKAVKKNLLGFQTGEAMTLAAAAIEAGKPAEAVRLIDERMTVLGLAARTWSDRDLDRDGALLDKYRTVLSELHRNPRLARADLGQYVSKSLSYAGYQLTR